MDSKKYLADITAGAPCGKEIWFAESRYQLQQPLEQAWQNGDEASWADIEDIACEHLARSRDLRIAVILCLAWLRSKGLVGFHDGLSLIVALLQQFGDQIHPVPDKPGDEVRQNVLSNLAAPLGNDTPYQFVKYLRETTLCRSATGTCYSLADVFRAESAPPAGVDPAHTAPASALIAATFRATPANQIDQVARHIEESLELVGRIEILSAGPQGQLPAVSLGSLRGVLTEMIGVVQLYRAAKANPVEAKVEPAPTTGGVPASSVPSTGIQSRTEADAALEAVCEYLRRNEPSSPVPLLIERARRLLRLDFLESMRDLAPDSIERFNTLFGLKNREKNNIT
jgi:type VI secretion system protein ImpA